MSPTTVPSLLPQLVRVVRNGNVAGSGMRVYVPAAVARELQILPGQVYRFNRSGDRYVLVPVDGSPHDAEARPAGPPATPRIRPELTLEEATAIEACLVLAEGPTRQLLLDVAKRMRRRMRLAGWPTPDRREDHLELSPHERAQIAAEATA